VTGAVGAAAGSAAAVVAVVVGNHHDNDDEDDAPHVRSATQKATPHIAAAAVVA
jgi:hypothetical protein